MFLLNENVAIGPVLARIDEALLPRVSVDSFRFLGKVNSTLYGLVVVPPGPIPMSNYEKLLKPQSYHDLPVSGSMLFMGRHVDRIHCAAAGALLASTSVLRLLLHSSLSGHVSGSDSLL